MNDEKLRLRNMLSADEMKLSIIAVSLGIFIFILIVLIGIVVVATYIKGTTVTIEPTIWDSVVTTIKTLINALAGINIFNTGANAVSNYASSRNTNNPV